MFETYVLRIFLITSSNSVPWSSSTVTNLQSVYNRKVCVYPKLKVSILKQSRDIYIRKIWFQYNWYYSIVTAGKNSKLAFLTKWEPYIQQIWFQGERQLRRLVGCDFIELHVTLQFSPILIFVQHCVARCVVESAELCWFGGRINWLRFLDVAGWLEAVIQRERSLSSRDTDRSIELVVHPAGSVERILD